MVEPTQSLPNGRPRVCAAILRGNEILLVHHVHADGRDYWTLPGGGVEPGETLPEAAEREVLEETGLKARVIRQLYERPYSLGIETCFLAEVEDGNEPSLGGDPEDIHLPLERRVLRGVGWMPIAKINGHPQSAKLHEAIQLLGSEHKP